MTGKIITSRWPVSRTQLKNYQEALERLDQFNQIDWLAKTIRMNRKALKKIRPGIIYEVEYEVLHYAKSTFYRGTALIQIQKIAANQVCFYTFLTADEKGREMEYYVNGVPLNMAGTQGVYRETRLVSVRPATTDRLPVYITMHEAYTGTLNKLTAMLKGAPPVL